MLMGNWSWEYSITCFVLWESQNSGNETPTLIVEITVYSCMQSGS